MKVVNIHSRTIHQPIEKVGALLSTLASKQDRIWPSEKWPAMKFKAGLVLHAKGGHGPIRYTITKYIPNKSIEFTFSPPKGFYGTHSFEFTEKTATATEVKHTIDMYTKGTGTLTWLLAVRWLHDALLEDALDKIENQFSPDQKTTKMNWYVRMLRWVAKRF